MMGHDDDDVAEVDSVTTYDCGKSLLCDHDPLNIEEIRRHLSVGKIGIDCFSVISASHHNPLFVIEDFFLNIL